MTLPIIKRAQAQQQRPALIDAQSEYSYAQLLGAAQLIAASLLGDRRDLQEARIAFMVPPGFDYVAAQWGIWLAGGIAVPLCISHPLPEVEYVTEDSGAEIIIAHPVFQEKLQGLAERKRIHFVLTTEALQAEPVELPDISEDRRAMILYTSGTTSRPKGVVNTHRNITSQITTLIEAWGWMAEDRILHVLPLHHTHGIINALLCPLWAGAVCEMLPQFDAGVVWERFMRGNITVFMAVPTVYIKLIEFWENAAPEEQKKMSQACAKMRLMVSGSAALPVSVFEKWKAISGHALLERYGMTEIGMAISNPLHGERRPGYIGFPLPRVQIRLMDESGSEVKDEGAPGEIQVKGPNVFLEYWRRPEATQEAFVEDWFRSGDVAVVENGYYRILGRSSVDIIKTGGYKVSALEIEEILRGHPCIKECAVVGVEDAEWGERVCAAITLQNNAVLDLEELRRWAKKKMAVYKIPSRLAAVEELPRNAMGKVTKPEVKVLFQE
ncbi:MAG: AMP-binding protein [Calditrichaceae bacterium]|nr:AMP-binding protein [Calditrichaceae bacterium]